jgi:hypothetical protein
MNRPIYLLRLRPEKKVSSPIRALRRGLKFLLRSCSLRALSIDEIPDSVTREAQRASRSSTARGARGLPSIGWPTAWTTCASCAAATRIPS